MRWAVLGLLLWGAIAGLLIFWPHIARAEEITPRQVDNWLVAYSVKRSSPEYPYAQLVADVRRVVGCESHFELDVINGRRRGRAGEVGPGQFLPGRTSIYYLSDAAAAGWPMDDPEANVAATVQLIAAGYGPRHWSCW